jgi:catechol 2,3-dioxygenase-like lactoylglutathione lyase family enzyme
LEKNVIKARRIGHAAFETPDLERMIDYYTRVIGLVLAERQKDRAFLTSRTGLLAIQLNKGDAARCSMVSFEVPQIPTSAQWRAI